MKHEISNTNINTLNELAGDFRRLLTETLRKIDLNDSHCHSDTINTALYELNENQLIKDRIAQHGESIFVDHHYLGTIVIFFLPGTHNSTPFIVDGNTNAEGGEEWGKTKKYFDNSLDDTDREHDQKRFPDIAKKWRRNQATKDNTHLYFAHYNYLQNEKELGPSVKSSCPQNLGVLKNNLWLIDPPRSVIEINDGEKLFFQWDNKRWNEKTGVIATPIICQDDKFVTVTSYFYNPEEFTNDFINLHQLFANTIFLPIYSHIESYETSLLTNAIFGDLVKSNVFDLAAEYLAPPEFQREELSESSESVDNTLPYSQFTYKWQWGTGSRTQSLADIKSIITEHVSRSQNELTKTVLELLESIGTEIAREVNEHDIEKLISVSNLCNFNFQFNFQEELKMLSGLEKAFRNLGTTNRDHIFHQLQILIIGCCILHSQDKNCSHTENFLKKFKKNIFLKDFSAKEIGEIDENICLSLLLYCWYIVATHHDLGYPVQGIDGLIKKFREQIFKSLNLSCPDENLRLRIDHAFYDDPKTYLLLKEFTKTCVDILAGGTGQNSKDINTYDEDFFDTLWFFFRRYTFEKKHHSIVSALILMSSFIEQDNNNLREFFQTPEGYFLTRNIFMPVAFHHFYDWPIDLKKLKDKLNDISKPDSIEYKTLDSCIKYLNEVIFWEESIDGKYSGALEKNKISWENSPLSVLLILADIFQEDGRPSGSSKKFFPEIKSCNIDMLKNGVLRFQTCLVPKKEVTIDDTQDIKELIKDLTKKINRFELLNNFIKDLGDLKVCQLIDICGDTTTKIWFGPADCTPNEDCSCTTCNGEKTIHCKAAQNFMNDYRTDYGSQLKAAIERYLAPSSR